MRPKKRVLVAGENEQLRECYRMLVGVWGYALADAAKDSPEDVDAILMLFPTASGAKMAVQGFGAERVVVMPDSERGVQLALGSGARLIARNNHAVRDALRSACKRKTGPKRMVAA